MVEAVIALSALSAAMILAYCFQQEVVKSLDETNANLMDENRALRNKIKLMQEVDGKWRD